MSRSPVAAIILAAGASSRMGRPKALLGLPSRGSFAGAIADAATEAGVAIVCFVLGPPHGEAIRAALPPSARVAWNADPSRGMLSSIQAGIAAVQHEAEAALVWPVDQPLVSVATVRALLAAPADRIVIPVRAGRGGHPVRLPRALFPPVMALPHERGLRGLMEDEPARVLRIEVEDRGAVADVDTPGDYARIGQNEDRQNRE